MGTWNSWGQLAPGGVGEHELRKEILRQMEGKSNQGRAYISGELHTQGCGGKGALPQGSVLSDIEIISIVLGVRHNGLSQWQKPPRGQSLEWILWKF